MSSKVGSIYLDSVLIYESFFVFLNKKKEILRQNILVVTTNL